MLILIYYYIFLKLSFMSYIKIPLFLKILVYILFFILLLILIIIPTNFLSIFSFYYFSTLILTILWFILFFHVLKGNGLSVKLFSLFILLIFWLFFILLITINKENILINIFYTINIFSTFFLLFLFFMLYLTNKRIKKWLNNLENKYLTNKNQHNTFIFTFLLYTILLLIFRFWYYNIEKNIENYDDFFISKYQNIDIKDEDNLFYDLQKLSEIKYNIYFNQEKIQIVDCIYFDKCSKTLNQYKDFITKIKDWEETNFRYEDKYNEEIEKDKISSKIYLRENIDVLYNFDENFNYETINDLWKKKYFKIDFDFDEITNHILITRDLKYKILYYINNNQEEKAIELLVSNINISYTILNWDAWLITSLSSITSLSLSYGIVDLLINNFELNTESKNKLFSALNREVKKEFLDNWLIIDNIITLKYLKKINDEFNSNWLRSSLFDYEYTKKIFQEFRYYSIKSNEKDLSYDLYNDYEKIMDFYRVKYEYPIMEKRDFFKKNIIWKILFHSSYLTYNPQYKRLYDLEKYRIELLEKLNK